MSSLGSRWRAQDPHALPHTLAEGATPEQPAWGQRWLTSKQRKEEPGAPLLHQLPRPLEQLRAPAAGAQQHGRKG